MTADSTLHAGCGYIWQATLWQATTLSWKCPRAIFSPSPRATTTTPSCPVTLAKTDETPRRFKPYLRVLDLSRTDGIKLVDKALFKQDTVMHTLLLPASLEQINSAAFSGSTKLESVTCYATTPPTMPLWAESNPFKDTPATLIIFVPAESLPLYAAADGWKEFKHILPISTLGISSFSADGRSFEVYNLQGRKVRHEATSLDGLPKGVYIINGKKIVK